MSRGFNVLEMMVVLALMSVILSVAVPNLYGVFVSIKMKRLASEVTGFVAQAKSEAVLRNQRLYAHFSLASYTANSEGTWSLELTDSITAGGQRLLILDGKAFDGITVRHSYGLGYISFDGVRGRPTGGAIEFSPQHNSMMTLKAIMANPPGRLRICGENGALYGYSACY